MPHPISHVPHAPPPSFPPCLSAGLRVLVLEKSGAPRMRDLTHLEEISMPAMYDQVRPGGGGAGACVMKW